MKIILDPQIFLTQQFGGISRLFVELWKYFQKEHLLEVECPLVYSENLHLKDAGLQPHNIFQILNHLHFRGTWRIKETLNEISLNRTIKKLQKDETSIFLPTYFNTYFLEFLNGQPFVLTVYDMIHETFPEYFAEDKITVIGKKLLIDKAERIVAISQQTKNDILRFYPYIPEKKISVIYLAQSIRENDPVPAIDLPEKFILFVGSRGNYKNFTLFIETIAPMLKEDPSLYVVCAGGYKFTETEYEMLAKLGIQNKVIQKNYKDSELPAFYRAAKLFVFPSAYEGFGIPTLEAMKCGCPVVLANSSCLPEIGGDAAVYFETGSRSSLEEAIRKTMNDEKFRKQLIEKGYQREKQFSWAKTAKEYYSVIQQVIE